MIFNGPFELLSIAEKFDLIKIVYCKGSKPVVNVIKLHEFRMFLLEVANKTDFQPEKEFCLTQFNTFNSEFLEKNKDITQESIQEFSSSLNKCETVDDILNIL